MNFSSYEGPRNGDYVTYVDQLMRASPEFRRAQQSIAGAIQDAVVTPGSQPSSPMNRLRSTLQKARDMAEQTQQSLVAAPADRADASTPKRATAPQRPISKDEAKQRFRAREQEAENQKTKSTPTPWISPTALGLIVGGAVMARFVSGFGQILLIMGVVSLVGGVLKRLQGK